MDSMRHNMDHDVFISFSFQDRTIAERIVNTLASQHDIVCWICTQDLIPGQLFKAKIPDAIDVAKVVVLVQTADALKSREIPKEIGLALDSEKPIIPFRLDHAQLQGALRYDLNGVEYIDGTQDPFEARIDELAASIKSVLRQQQKAAPVAEQPMRIRSSVVPCSTIFYGRDGLLEQIHRTFQAGEHTVFLRGMGGIGKSEIARQYAKRYHGDYPTVIFARYENSIASLVANDTVFEIEGIVRKTKANGLLQTDEEYALDKLQALQRLSDEGTLILLDNFDVQSDPFLEKLAREGHYRLLVTTRCEPEHGKYPVIPVNELDDDALKDLVMGFAGDDVAIDPEDPAFPALFEMTHRHTLTLELIAKYMFEECIDDIGEITQTLSARGLQALADSEHDSFAHIRNLFHMTERTDAEKYFLSCLAMLPPSGIHMKLFQAWCGEAYNARSRLTGLSLVKLDRASKTLSLHPIIRDVVIAELKPGMQCCRDFIDHCAMVGICANEAMWLLPYDQKRVYLECYDSILRFLPQITKDNFEVFVNIGYLKNFVDTYTNAMAFQKRLLNFAQQTYGPDSFEAMLVLSNLGWENLNNLMPETALEYYHQATEGFLANPDRKSAMSQLCIRDTAHVYYLRYARTDSPLDRDTAFDYIRKSLQYGQEYLDALADPDCEEARIVTYHMQCAGCLYSKLYTHMGDYDSAQYWLDDYKKVLSKVDLYEWHRDYGKLKLQLGQYDLACQALQTAYDLFTTYFSDKNAFVVEVLEGLAQCYQHSGDVQKADRALQQALDTARMLFTEDHPILLRLQK